MALIENKKTTFGFVGVPCKNEIYWGGKDFGSWKINIVDNYKYKLKINKFSNKLKIAVSRSHLSIKTKELLNNISVKYELFPVVVV